MAKSSSIDRSTRGGVKIEDIVMGSRVRLARNLDGRKFPDWASVESRQEVLKEVTQALRRVAPKLKVEPIKQPPKIGQRMLFERNMISRKLLEVPSGSGVAMAADKKLSVMINEEDHVRIQGFAKGLDMQAAWERADKLDTLLEEQLTYAWDARYGYLTACPGKIGSAMCAGAMLHLVGLNLMREWEQVKEGLYHLQVRVRGLGGDDTLDSGHIYQITNIGRVGDTEAEVLARAQRICGEVVRLERNARLRVLRDVPLLAQDYVSRTLGILKNARLLESDEAIDMLSKLRFGIAMEMIFGMPVAEVDALIFEVQFGHFMDYLGEEVSDVEFMERLAGFVGSIVEHLS